VLLHILTTRLVKNTKLQSHQHTRLSGYVLKQIFGGRKNKRSSYSAGLGVILLDSIRLGRRI